MKTKYIVLATSIILATSTLTGLSTVSAAPNKVQENTVNVSTNVITIDPFYNTSMVLMGKAPGAVKVELSVNGNVLASTFVTSMFYFYPNNLGISEPGTKFELTAYNTYGKVMETTSFVTQMDTSLKAPTITNCSADMSFVLGKMTGGPYVSAVLFVDGKKVTQTFIASNQFTFLGVNLKKGQTVEVAGMTSNGVLGPKASVIVD